MNVQQLSRGLGWFSVGLGLVELFAPRKLAESIGVRGNHDGLIRALGAREMASGLALLSGVRPKEAVWSRVVGDVMDLTLLGASLYTLDRQPFSVSRSRETDRRRLIGAIVAVAGVTAVDALAGLRLSRGPRLDPSWRYSPEGGRAGIDRAALGNRSLAQNGRREFEGMAKLPVENASAASEPAV